MKVAFFVNQIGDEAPYYTTTRLAMAAAELGHEAYYFDVESFVCDPDRPLRARGRPAPSGAGSLDDFLTAVQEAEDETVEVERLDALMLRWESEIELAERPWGNVIAMGFAHLAKSRGVLVVNDPAGLAEASSKLYLESFPPEIRPRSLITRDPDDITSFIEAVGGSAVVKPLHGAKGESVFFVRPDSELNLNQIIETVLKDGYAIAQEFLEAATEGDTRVLILDGEPMHKDGSYAAFRRVPGEDDLRSNMSVGGKGRPADVDGPILEITSAIAPKLKTDGMFFVGIDIVGDKLIELNVESPGGIASASKFAGVDFSKTVIEALEAKAAAHTGGD